MKKTSLILVFSGIFSICHAMEPVELSEQRETTATNWQMPSYSTTLALIARKPTVGSNRKAGSLPGATVSGQILTQRSSAGQTEQKRKLADTEAQKASGKSLALPDGYQRRPGESFLETGDLKRFSPKEMAAYFRKSKVPSDWSAETRLSTFEQKNEHDESSPSSKRQSILIFEDLSRMHAISESAWVAAQETLKKRASERASQLAQEEADKKLINCGPPEFATLEPKDWAQLHPQDFVNRATRCGFRPEELTQEPLKTMMNKSLYYGHTALFIAANNFLFSIDEDVYNSPYLLSFGWLLISGADPTIKSTWVGFSKPVTVMEFLRFLHSEFRIGAEYGGLSSRDLLEKIDILNVILGSRAYHADWGMIVNKVREGDLEWFRKVVERGLLKGEDFSFRDVHVHAQAPMATAAYLFVTEGYDEDREDEVAVSQEVDEEWKKLEKKLDEKNEEAIAKEISKKRKQLEKEKEKDETVIAKKIEEERLQLQKKMEKEKEEIKAKKTEKERRKLQKEKEKARKKEITKAMWKKGKARVKGANTYKAIFDFMLAVGADPKVRKVENGNGDPKIGKDKDENGAENATPENRYWDIDDFRIYLKGYVREHYRGNPTMTARVKELKKLLHRNLGVEEAFSGLTLSGNFKGVVKKKPAAEWDVVLY